MWAAVQQGVESVIFLAGVSGASAPTAIPLSAVVGIIAGCLVGVLLYYSCALLAAAVSAWSLHAAHVSKRGHVGACGCLEIWLIPTKTNTDLACVRCMCCDLSALAGIIAGRLTCCCTAIAAWLQRSLGLGR